MCKRDKDENVKFFLINMQILIVNTIKIGKFELFNTNFGGSNTPHIFPILC